MPRQSMENDVYVGGNFSQVGTLPVNNIARWDGTTWHSVGEGIPFVDQYQQVTAIAISGSNLYVAVNSNRGDDHKIVQWDGSSWRTLSEETGLTRASVNTLVQFGVDKAEVLVKG